MDNYLKLRCFSPAHEKYIYLDTGDFLSADLMTKAGVFQRRVRVMAKKNSPYRLIICKIRKKDEPRFLSALEELRNKALILGYQDYDSMCEKLRRCAMVV